MLEPVPISRALSGQSPVWVLAPVTAPWAPLTPSQGWGWPGTHPLRWGQFPMGFRCVPAKPNVRVPFAVPVAVP